MPAESDALDTSSARDPRSTIADTHGLTPAKPPRPSTASLPQVPQPIDVDVADVVPAVTLPDAEETFPAITQENPIVDSTTGSIPVSPYLYAYIPSDGTQQSSNEPADEPGSTSAEAGRTPSRKVPRSVAALMSIGTLPESDQDVPSFVPRYEPASGAGPPPPAIASSVPVQPSTTLPAKRRSPLEGATLEDSDEPEYAPTVAAPPFEPYEAPDNDPTVSTGDDVTDDDSEVPDSVTVTDLETSPANGDADGIVPPVVADDSHGRNGGSGSIWSSTAFLVILGIVVMAGIGYAVFALFLKPETVQLPTQNVVSAPVEPTLEPVALTDPSAFLAAMPTSVGAYVLTEYTTQSDTNPDSAAEIDTLNYSDGSSQIVVTSIQHYNISEAQRTFEELNVNGSQRKPVVVAGEEVGEQVTVTSDAGATVLWINNTAVFTATGDDDSVLRFVSGFGF